MSNSTATNETDFDTRLNDANGASANTGAITITFSNSIPLTSPPPAVTLASGNTLTVDGSGNALGDGSAQTLTVSAGDQVTLENLDLNGVSIEDASTGPVTLGVIGGTGSVMVDGNGTLTVNASDSYTGGTTVSSGTLQLGDGVNDGSIAGSVVDDAALVIDNTGNTTLNAISGTGSVEQAGSGTTFVNTAETYTGGTTISNGTLQLGDGSSDGSLGGGITDNAALVIDDNGNVTLNAVSGTGSVEQAGIGTTTVISANTYTGGTTISGGTLQLGDGANDGSVMGTITDNTALVIDNAGATTLNAITGVGDLTQQGGGTTTVAVSEAYSGATTITGGTLAVTGTGSIAASSALDMTGTATLDLSGATGAETINNLTGSTGSTLALGGTELTIDQDGTETFAGTITGTGALTKQGGGTLILTGTDNASGGTTIAAGTLQLGNGTAPTALTGNIVDNATLDVDGSSNSTLTLAGTISGTGALTLNGKGTTTLSAAESYTGATTINGGIAANNKLALTGAGSVAASAGVDLGSLDATFDISGASGAETVQNLASGAGSTIVLGANQLTFGTAGNTTLAGGISGSGDLVKQGSGTVTLTGADASTGSFSINAGTLQLDNGTTNGSIAGAIIDDATLAVDETGAQTVQTISGIGTLRQIGSGTLTLSGSNTYMGGTTLSAGTLDVSAAGAAGSGAITFAGPATLDIAAAALTNGVFGNTIADFAAGDTIDIGGIGTATSATLDANGVLTVTGSAGTAQFATTGISQNALFAFGTDGNGGTDLSVSVDTTPPVAPSSNLTVAQNAAATAIGIAAPSDANYPASALSITATGLPNDGTVTLADGTAVTSGQALSVADLTGLLFTPNANTSNLQSSFTYTVSDPSNLTATGTATLAVSAPTTPPASLQGTVSSSSNANGTQLNGTNPNATPLTLPGVAAPAPDGVSTADYSSLDFVRLLSQGNNLQFISGTTTVQLVDGQISFGPGTSDAGIQRLYVGLLGHESDAAGQGYWEQQIASGATLQDVASGIIASAEFQGSQGGDTGAQFVNNLYMNLFGRTADAGGLGYWTGVLQSGTSMADVAAGIAQGGEAQTDQAAATNVVYGQNADGTLVNELYEAGLGREVSQSEEQFWIGALNSGGSAAEVAQGIAASAEFQADHAGQDANAFVTSLYQNALGRAPDAGGLDYYGGGLQTGSLTQSGVLLSITQTQEAQAVLTRVI